jgi:hypothetical protein
MIWNTQHLNDQNQKKPMSAAYNDKKALLDKLITSDSPDLIALFEVGTTGKPNQAIVADLAGQYTLVGALAAEGAATVNTTLGSLVFARNAVAADYSAPSFGTVLGAGHRRASVVIRHKANGSHFAFYHANASNKAWGNIKSEIDHLQDQIGQEHGSWLAFFGGDLNSHDAPASATDPIYHKRMTRRRPLGPGYTHVSAKHSGPAEMDTEEAVDFYMGGEVEYGLIVTLSMLDFAYVPDGLECEGECKASVVGRRNWKLDGMKGAVKTLNIEKQPKKPFSSIEKSYDGTLVRSDHFPVFYTLG